MTNKEFLFTYIPTRVYDENGYKIIGKYRILKKTLGQGTYGKVKLCEEIHTNKLHAVKVYHTGLLSRIREFSSKNAELDGTRRLRVTSALDKVISEISLTQNHLQKHGTPVNCVTLEELFLMSLPSETNNGGFSNSMILGYPAPSKLYLIMDLLPLGPIMKQDYISIEEEDATDTAKRMNTDSNHDNELNNFIHTRSALDRQAVYKRRLDNWDTFISEDVPCTTYGYPESLVKCFLKDIAEAVNYIHSQNISIAHRDIKPDNLLLDEHGHVYLADFSVASLMAIDGKLRGTEGTYMFLPPECTKLAEENQEYNGHDGRAADVWALGVTLWVALFGKLPFYAKSLEKLFNAIADGILVFDRNVDANLSTSCKDLLCKMLEKDPDQRLTIQQVLEHPWLCNIDYTVAERFAKTLSETMHHLNNEDIDESF